MAKKGLLTPDPHNLKRLNSQTKKNEGQQRVIFQHFAENPPSVLSSPRWSGLGFGWTEPSSKVILEFEIQTSVCPAGVKLLSSVCECVNGGMRSYCKHICQHRGKKALVSALTAPQHQPIRLITILIVENDSCVVCTDYQSLTVGSVEVQDTSSGSTGAGGGYCPLPDLLLVTLTSGGGG